MIKHIVFITHETTDHEEKQIFLKTLKNKIDKLKSQIEEIQHIQTGLNISESDKAFDFCLTSDFKSLDDLETYRVHPEHKAVLDYLQQHNIKLAVVDYEY